MDVLAIPIHHFALNGDLRGVKVKGKQNGRDNRERDFADCTCTGHYHFDVNWTIDLEKNKSE